VLSAICIYLSIHTCVRGLEVAGQGGREEVRRERARKRDSEEGGHSQLLSSTPPVAQPTCLPYFKVNIMLESERGKVKKALGATRSPQTTADSQEPEES
jgi:hypothetical protein